MAKRLRFRVRDARDGGAPADLAVRVDGLDWSVRRPVASSSARAALGRPGWVAVARTASAKAARSGRLLRDGPAGEERLEGVLDGGVVGCCGHLTPVIAGGARRGARAAPTFSAAGLRAGRGGSAARGAGGP